MKIKQLVKKGTSDFATKEISKYDPYAEYFLLDQTIKNCYILRKVFNNIILINLKCATPTPKIIKEEDFIDLCDDFILLEIPSYTGGIEYYTQNIQKQENKTRKEIFEYLINNGYFD